MITPIRLPASFIKEGYLSAGDVRKTRRLLLGTDGPPDSGKTEFALSAPGPGIVLGLDRGFDAVLDNQFPPATRRPDFAFKVITVPKATSVTQSEALDYWRTFYAAYKGALSNTDARTVVLDGDSDSWELQRLAEFGKLTQIPPILYTNVNSARRAMIARAWDSGKIVIATSKLSRDYKAVLNADGTPVLKDGKEIREWDGHSMHRQGFADQDYLWQLQIRHLYRTTPREWGIKIMKCKADMSLVGLELWGDDCNFPSLVQTVYPHIPLSEWGY